MMDDGNVGLNMIVCVVIGVVQFVIWVMWGFMMRYLVCLKLWIVVFGVMFVMLLEVFDFLFLWGIFDVYVIWYVVILLIMYLWWGFIKDDVIFRIELLVKKGFVDL